MTLESLTNLILIYFQVKFLLLLTLWLTLLGEVAAQKPPRPGDSGLCPSVEDHIVKVDIRIRRRNQGVFISRNLQNRSISPWDYKYVPRRLISMVLGKTY